MHQFEPVEIRDDMIRLGQLLKLAGVVQEGSEARAMIENGEVLVNGVVELRRGRQVRPGDEIECPHHRFRVHACP